MVQVLTIYKSHKYKKKKKKQQTNKKLIESFWYQKSLPLQW